MAGDIFGLSGLNPSALSTGQSVSPVFTFSSETSLGFYRSAASTVALSYGTLTASTVSATVLNVAGATTMSALSVTALQASSTVSSANTLRVGGQAWLGSGISVGTSANTGTLINAISAVSCALPVHVVQGSASSFTILVWPAVKPLDGITVAPLGAAISSVSSGLVFHSHCTVAGQCEIRISNVSTLVQNQSAITLALYRFSAF